MIKLISLFFICILATVFLAEMLNIIYKLAVEPKILMKENSSNVSNIRDGFELVYNIIYTLGATFAAITLCGLILKFIINIYRICIQ